MMIMMMVDDDDGDAAVSEANLEINEFVKMNLHVVCRYVVRDGDGDRWC
jgi:hypothetical protein